MREEQLVVGDVPTRVYTPKDASGLLLLGHGGGHSKDGERFVALSRHYAERTGLAVVCIDAVDHGERRASAVTGEVPPGWHSRTAGRMVADWQAVAEGLVSIGPPIAYVGFSMGTVFGFRTVAAMPTITAAVFVAGGIPGDDWTDDPDLEPLLASAAARLDHAHVLMLNNHDDELFPVLGVRRLFDSVSAQSKTLTFSPGSHDDWPAELIATSVGFVNEHRTRAP